MGFRRLKKKSKTKIARVYSTALYDAAIETGQIEKVWVDVEKLQKLIKNDGDFESYLTNPLWSENDKIEVVEKAAKVLNLNKETLNCLKVVSENQKMGELVLILDEFGKLYYLKNGVVEVVVETAKKLSSAQDKKLQKVLEEVLQSKIAVKYSVNSALLGGLRVQCGSKLYDDSLANKLNYLEKIMKGK